MNFYRIYQYLQLLAILWWNDFQQSPSANVRLRGPTYRAANYINPRFETQLW